MHKADMIKQMLDVISFRLKTWNESLGKRVVPRDQVPEVLLFYRDRKADADLDRDPQVIHVAMTGLLGGSSGRKFYAQEVARTVVGKPKPKMAALFIEAIEGEDVESGSFSVVWAIDAISANGELCRMEAHMYVHEWKAWFPQEDIRVNPQATASPIIHAYRPYGVTFPDLTDWDDSVDAEEE